MDKQHPSDQNISQNSSHLLNLLMEHVPYSIYFKDKESRFIKINRECAEKFGLDDPEEAVGKTDFDFFEANHAQRAFDEEQKIIETGEPIIRVLESEGQHESDKRTHWASTSKFPFYDDDQNIIGTFGITGDVTDQIHAEEALRKSEEKYRKIFDNIQDVFYRTDEQGIVTEISPSIEKYSGYKRSEIIGVPVINFYYHQEDREDLIRELLQTGKVTDYEIRLKTSDGRLVYTSVTSHVVKDKADKFIGVEGIMRDISERKIAELKLKERDETLSKLSEQVPGTIYQFQQFPDGSSRFPFASKGIEDNYEVSAEEVKMDASKAINRTHSEDLDRLIESINHSYRTLTDWQFEYRVDLPKKGVRWLLGNARPEKQKDDSVIWHGYITDVTDRKMKERALSKTMDIVSDQNKKLLNFAHIVSHNLRNHASNISMILSILEDEKDEGVKEEFFEHLNTASTRLNETIQDLNEIVDLQTKSDENTQEINFNKYLIKIKEILTTEIISKNVKIKESVPEDFVIDYNPAYMESILLNLISNAIKYRHPERDPVIEITVATDDGSPTLTVSDNGIGMDLEKYGSKLFGMYNTFHGNEDSKGIGLYITKNQVESMGGSIEVESTEGEGTTFIIHFFNH